MTTPIDNIPVYMPSGRLSSRTIPVLLLIGVPVALLCGWIYAQVLVSSQWMPLSIMVSGFSGTVIAIVAFAVLRYSRSRSITFNKYAAGTFAFVALWARWITTLLVFHLPEAAADFATSGPLGWVRILGDFTAHLQTSTGAPSSLLLAAGWILELLFLISIAAQIGTIAAEEAFSETAGALAKKDFEGELFWPDGNSGALLDLLKAQGPAVLMRFHRASELTTASLASEWWTLRVNGKSVKADPLARWLDVNVLVHTRDESGKISSQSTPLIASMCVSDTDYAVLAVFVTGSDTVADASVSAAGEIAALDNSEPDQPTTPVELEPAVAALESENYGSAITLAHPHCQHPVETVRADAYRLCALAHARLGHWEDAFEHYHVLFEIEPNAFNAMQLASTSVTSGQLLRGNAWFEKADKINQQSREMQQPVLRTNFISALEQAGELYAAKPHLDWLADAYRLAKTTDDHQLWCYGLPFFGIFLRKSLPILRASCSEQDIAAWYESMHDDLDEQGREAIDRHLAELASVP